MRRFIARLTFIILYRIVSYPDTFMPY